MIDRSDDNNLAGRSSIAIMLAAIVLISTVAVSIPAAADLDDNDDALTRLNGKMTPLTWDLFKRGNSERFSTDDALVGYSDGRRGWFVKYEDDEDFDQIDDWLNSSDDRDLVDHDQDDNRVLVVAPKADILDRGILSADGLATRAYIEWVEVEQTIGIVDPIDMKSDDAFETEQKPRRLTRLIASIGGGEFTSSGLAYDEDVNRTGLDDVKSSIGADSLSSTKNGSGERLGFIDTGANVADGSNEGKVFGNGTGNSSVRIVAGKNFIDNTTINTSSGDYSAIEDTNGHGTYVAARAAGAGEGVADERAIAHDADLVIAKALDADGSGTTADIIDAIEWSCGEQDVDVLSLSLGTPFYSKAIEDELHECLVDDDVSAITIAVGNSRWSARWVQSPADSDGVISVAATTAGPPSNLSIGYFSNVGEDDGVTDGSGGETRGSLPTIGAPGIKNRVTVVDDRGNVVNETLTGTSMSTPDAAAAAIVLIDQKTSLKGDHEAVKERVEETASAAPDVAVTEIGHGQLNVSKMLDDDRTGDDQSGAMSSTAESRDKANIALSGDLATFLKKRTGIDL